MYFLYLPLYNSDIMKKIKYTSLFVLAFALFACGDKTPESTEETVTETVVEENNYKGMEMVDLTAYDIPASIYIADKDKGKQVFNPTSRESLEIEVGKKFGIEITPFGFSVAEKKEELSNSLVYSVEFIEDSPNKIVYKKTIPESDLDPEFHFFYTTSMNGDTYSVESLNKAYTEKSIQKMVSAAESLEYKTNS